MGNYIRFRVLLIRHCFCNRLSAACTASDTCQMTGFLLDHICVSSHGGQLLHPVAGIPMETDFAPLLADLFFYSYEFLINDGKSTRMEVLAFISTLFLSIIIPG